MGLTVKEALRRGVMAHQSGSLADADSFYTAALKIDSRHPDANHNMGVLAVAIGKLDRALPFFETAVLVNPKIAQYWVSYISALVDLGRKDDAENAFLKAQKKKLDGCTLKQLRQKIRQLQNNEMSSGHDPSQQNIQPLVALYEAKNFWGALQQVRELLHQYPNSNALLNLQGASYKGLRQLDEAINSFQKALNNNPLDYHTLNNIGFTYTEQGEFDTAIRYYQRALKVNPDFAEAHNNMGIAMQEKGHLDGALRCYARALEFKPDYPEVYNNIGNVEKLKGQFNRAIGNFKRAIKIKPNYVEAYSNAGGAYHKLGATGEAVTFFLQALTLDPNYLKGWLNIYFALKVAKYHDSSFVEQMHSLVRCTGYEFGCIQAQLLRHRLYLGGGDAQNCMHQALLGLDSCKNNSVTNPSNKIKADRSWPSPPLKTVALLHFGRSGTGLMHSLIDGHTAVTTLPSIYLSEFFDINTWEHVTSGGWHEMVDRFIAMYPVLFDASASCPVPTAGLKEKVNVGEKEGMTSVGELRNEVLRVNREVFRAQFIDLMECYTELDQIEFFRLMHVAYEKAIGRSHKNSVIFYHIHNPGTCAKLNFVRSAPEARWLMMVREPIQSCESWIRIPFRNGDYDVVIASVVAMLFQIDDVIFRNQNSVGLRLEDLKENPKDTINALCDWMDIEEQDSLYQMTAQGKKWWGDPTSPDFGVEPMEPFGKSSIDRKIGSIFSEHDRFVLQTLFYPFNVSFGYVEHNLSQFKRDLQDIRPMLEQTFDFEKALVKRMPGCKKDMIQSGSYQYLRVCMIERWNVLNEFHTYPNMLKPLPIKTLTSNII